MEGFSRLILGFVVVILIPFSHVGIWPQIQMCPILAQILMEAELVEQNLKHSFVSLNVIMGFTYLCLSMQFAISSGIITLCTMSTLFQYSDKSVVFIYFFLFGLSAIMLSFLISTFFTRAKTAVAVGTLSFLGAFFPYYSVNDQGGPMWVPRLNLPTEFFFSCNAY